MSPAAYAFLAAVVAAAAFIQGTIGVGFALIVAPVLGFLAPEVLPTCPLALMLPLNAYVAWRERAALDRTGADWITAGRFVGTFGGLWVLAMLPPSRLDLTIGAVTVLAAGGRVGAPKLSAAAALLPALVAGAALSRLVHRRVGGKSLRVFVLAFAAVSGTLLLLRGAG